MLQAEAMMLGAVPQKRWGEPEEVAEAVVFLCSDRAAFLTGHVMAIDGGFTAGFHKQIPPPTPKR